MTISQKLLMSAKKGAVWDGAYYVAANRNGSLRGNRLFKYIPGVSFVEDVDKIEFSSIQYGGKCAFSGDGHYLCLAQYLDKGGSYDNVIYKWDGTKWAIDQTNIGTQSTSTAMNNVVLNSDGSTLTAAGDTFSADPYPINGIVTLSRTGSSWTQTNKPATDLGSEPISGYRVTNLGADDILAGLRLANGQSDWFLLEANGANLDLLDNGGSNEYQLSATDDATRFIQGSNTSTIGFKTYSWNGTTATLLTDPSGVTDRHQGCVISPDGTQVAASHYDGKLDIYTWSGTQYVFEQALYTGATGKRDDAVLWTDDSQHLVHRTETYPYIYSYDRTGDSWVAGVSASYTAEDPNSNFYNFTMTKGTPT